MKHLQKISDLIAEHETALSAETEKAIAMQDGISAAATAEIERLQPWKESLNQVRAQFSQLGDQHRTLIESIRIGRIQIEQQLVFCAEREAIVSAIFNNPNSTPTSFWNMMVVKPHLQYAPRLVEEFRALLDKKTAELQDLENEIVAYSESAKIKKAD
jgi:hypothetical protein